MKHVSERRLSSRLEDFFAIVNARTGASNMDLLE
jgi:hypothetical protein